LGATAIGAGVGYGIGSVSHTTKRNSLYQQAMMQRAQGYKEGFKRTAKAHDAHLGHRKTYTRTGAVVGGAGAGTVLAGVLSWLAFRKKLAARRVVRKKEAVEMKRLREQSERNRLRDDRRARDRIENAAKTPRSTKPAQRGWPEIKPMTPKTVRTSGKTKRKRTRAQPILVNPEAQEVTVRTTREVFGLEGNSNRQITGLVNRTLKTNNISLSLPPINRTVKHSIPAGWKRINPPRQRERLAFHSELCVREAIQTNTSKSHLVIPYGVIETRLKISAQMPPALLVLRILARKKNIIIRGIPEKVRDEVKRVIDFA
jgi:hypothetical protein